MNNFFSKFKKIQNIVKSVLKRFTKIFRFLNVKAKKVQNNKR